MIGAERIAAMFYTHNVVWHKQGGRTATGSTPGMDVGLMASINTESLPHVTENNTEVIVSATVCWSPEHGVPQVGDHVTLPTKFGAKPRRRVVAARLADSGIPLLPNHVEVRLQ